MLWQGRRGCFKRCVPSVPYPVLTADPRSPSLQLLERARKAESEVITLRAQLKSDNTMTKKNLREMEATVAEQRSRTQKSEREYTTLKESIDGMKRNWKTDIDALKDEMNRRDEKARTEGVAMAKKYRKMADELKASQTDGKSIKKMKAEDAEIRKEVEDGFRDQIKLLKDEMDKQAKENSEAVNTARFAVPSSVSHAGSLHVFAESSPRNSVDCEG